MTVLQNSIIRNGYGGRIIFSMLYLIVGNKVL